MVNAKRQPTETAAQHTDAVITAALIKAVERRPGMRLTVDRNTVDAFTAALADAGVDMDDLDAVFEQADASRIA